MDDTSRLVQDEKAIRASSLESEKQTAILQAVRSIAWTVDRNLAQTLLDDLYADMRN